MQQLVAESLRRANGLPQPARIINEMGQTGRGRHNDTAGSKLSLSPAYMTVKEFCSAEMLELVHLDNRPSPKGLFKL